MIAAVLLAFVVLVISLFVELGQHLETRRRRAWELVWLRGWTVRRFRD